MNTSTVLCRSARSFAAAASLSLTILFAPVNAVYADGGGGGITNTKIKCKKGKVWDKKKKKCIDKEETSSLDQDSIYETGRDLAYVGRYEEAITILGLVHNHQDVRVLNMLGFSHRKSGNMDLALSFYQKAIDHNPDYSLVREYLGEAYIQLGMLEKAREQLSEIERICSGRTCGEYRKLADLIVAEQT